MGAANYRYLAPWALANVGNEDQSSEKASEEQHELAPISTNPAYATIQSAPGTATRSGYSFDQHEEQDYGDDRQYTDIVAQRLI